MYPEVLSPLLERGQEDGRWHELKLWDLPLWHELLNLDDKDGISQGHQLGQPTATLSSCPTPPPYFTSVSSPGRGVTTSSPALQLLLVSTDFVCSSGLGISWCTATHPWERDLLPAGSGQSSEQACWAVVPKAGWCQPLSPQSASPK